NEFAFRCVFKNVCPMYLGWMRVRVVDIRGRAHRDEEPPAVERKRQVSGPVTAAGGKVGHEHLRGGARLQIAVLVRESNDGIRVAHVYPFGVRSRAIERDAVRAVEAGGE